MPMAESMPATTGGLQNIVSPHEFVKLALVSLVSMALTAGVIGCATTPMKADTTQSKVDEPEQKIMIVPQPIASPIVQPKVVETEKIILKDATGNVRFEVSVKEDGSLVHTLRDAKGNERINLTVDAEGVARHNLFDDTGTIRVGSYAYPGDHQRFAGKAGTAFFNKDGKSLMQLETHTTGEVSHILFDRNGNERISLRLLNDGMAIQRFRDAKGTIRTSTYTDTSGETAFNLFDAQQRVRFRNIMLPDGKVMQSFIGKSGKEKESTILEDNDTLTHNVETGTVRKVFDSVGKTLKRMLPGDPDK